MGYIPLCELDLRFGEIHACNLEALTQHQANRDTGTAAGVENLGIRGQPFDQLAQQADIPRVALTLREIAVSNGVVALSNGFIEIHIRIIKHSTPCFSNEIYPEMICSNLPNASSVSCLCRARVSGLNKDQPSLSESIMARRSGNRLGLIKRLISSSVRGAGVG